MNFERIFWGKVKNGKKLKYLLKEEKKFDKPPPRRRGGKGVSSQEAYQLSNLKMFCWIALA